MALTQQDIFNARKQENEIIKELQSKSKEYYDSTRNYFYLGFMILAFFAVISVIPILIIFNPQDEGATYLVLSLFLLTFIFLRTALFVQVYSARKKHSKFDDFLDHGITLSRILFSTSLEPIREAYLSEKLLPTIASLSASQRERLINIYIKKSEKIKNSNWYVITILGVMLFAVWTGFISAVIGQEKTYIGMMGSFIVFFAISLILTFFVCVYKQSLERIFLKKSFNFLLLAEIITMIDSLDKAQFQDSPIPPVS